MCGRVCACTHAQTRVCVYMKRDVYAHAETGVHTCTHASLARWLADALALLTHGQSVSELLPAPPPHPGTPGGAPGFLPGCLEHEAFFRR